MPPLGESRAAAWRMANVDDLRNLRYDSFAITRGRHRRLRYTTMSGLIDVIYSFYRFICCSTKVTPYAVDYHFRQDHASLLVRWFVTLAVIYRKIKVQFSTKFRIDVQHRCQILLLTPEKSSPKVKVRGQGQNCRTENLPINCNISAVV